MATKVSPYKPISFKDFSGGWNADSAPDMLADNECEVFDNIDTSISGALKQRGGTVKLNDSEYSDVISLLLEWNHKDGTTEYLAMVGNNLCYLLPDDADAWKADTIITLDDPSIGYFFFNDVFYFTGKKEGLNNYWKVSKIYQVGAMDINGTVTTGGTLTVKVISAHFTSSIDVVVNVPLDSLVSETAQSIVEALKLNNEITTYFTVSRSSDDVVLTDIKGVSDPADLDSTFSMTLTLGTAVGPSGTFTDLTENGTKQKGLLDYDEACTGSGTVQVTITSVLLVSPITVSFAVTKGDSTSTLASKTETALKANATVNAAFTITLSGSYVYLEYPTEAENDETFNIAFDEGTANVDEVFFTIKEFGAPAGSCKPVVANTDATNDLSSIKKCRNFVWNPVNFRVFATGNPDDVSAVYYSEGNDPTFFKATNKVYPTRGEGACIGLSNFSTGIVVEYENAIWAWTGYDPATDATWGRLPIVHGAISHGSVCSTPNSLTMVGIGGLYALNPGALDKDLMMINAAQMSINLSINRVTSVLKDICHPSTMVSCYDNMKQRYLLAYGDDPNNSQNNRILVYDFARNCFSRFTGIQTDSFCATADGRILIGSGTYLLQLDEGVNDWDISTDGYKAIATWVRTKGWDFNNPFVVKKIKKTFVAAYQFATSGTTIDLGVIGGYRSQVFETVPSIVYEDAELPDSFVWGAEWGQVWGWADLITREFRTRMKATRFAIDIKHEVIDEDMLIYGFAFLYRNKKAKGVRYHGTPSKDILS